MKRLLLLTALLPAVLLAGENRAVIDASGPGWRPLGKTDFENINCAADTWTWKDGTASCSGKPTGVIASKILYRNFECLLSWRHLRDAGNSGVFVWATKDSLDRLRKGQGHLPDGIEVQVLDPGFGVAFQQRTGKQPDWFTCHGDVFPVRARMTPFPPVAPNGQRSFPSKQLTRDTGEWNHYYIRCINGEVRLWVNGEEVSGGTGCQPSSGYLCLESEGSPVEFKDLKIRVLP